MKPKVTLYTRTGCHLCEDAKRVLAEARKRIEFDYEEFDIDRDPALHALYHEEVPVVALVEQLRYLHRVGGGSLAKIVSHGRR